MFPTMTFHVIRGQITKERRPHLPVTHSACIRQIQLILLQLGEQAVIRETEGTMCAEAAAAPQLKQPSRTTEHVSSKGFTDYCGYFTSARYHRKLRPYGIQCAADVPRPASLADGTYSSERS